MSSCCSKKNASSTELKRIWPSDLGSDPIFEPDLDNFKKNILTKFQTSEAKNVLCSVNKIFLQIDLLTYFLTQHNPCLELDLYITKTNILIKFHHTKNKNAVSRVLTRFSFNLA